MVLAFEEDADRGPRLAVIAEDFDRHQDRHRQQGAGHAPDPSAWQAMARTTRNPSAPARPVVDGDGRGRHRAVGRGGAPVARRRRAVRCVLLAGGGKTLLGSGLWAGGSGQLPEFSSRTTACALSPEPRAPSQSEFSRSLLEGDIKTHSRMNAFTHSRNVGLSRIEEGYCGVPLKRT